MLPSKKNILQTVSLLKAYGVRHIVLTPGSRNAPVIQAFTQVKYFDCHLIVDERNAAYYALGIIQNKKEPVVVCCTSGTALLNFAPAVAEAYYQNLPLIVISADRAGEWIGQMDGQTIYQPGAFQSYIKKSVNLTEIITSDDEWFCNRLVNEALITCTSDYPGPVHINIPLREPLFDYSVAELPEVRKISYYRPKRIVEVKKIADIWNETGKKIILVGQMFPDKEITMLLHKLNRISGSVILSEHLANCNNPEFIHNFDVILYKQDVNTLKELAPDLLITLGGHIVSKRAKNIFRTYKPKYHWHLSQSDQVVDLFQSLTDLIETDNISFLRNLLYSSENNNSGKEYSRLWFSHSNRISEPYANIAFSDIYASGQLLQKLKPESKLILANSSAVRNAQYFNLDASIEIYCNRGTNGIEGSLPTAVGFASVSKKPVYLIIGDLSFFYGLNSLWNINHIKNLRILLLNNGGGSIFYSIAGLNKSESLPDYVAAGHNTNAEKWAEAAGILYLRATDKEELDKQMNLFMDEFLNRSIILEVITQIEVNQTVMREYYNNQ